MNTAISVLQELNRRNGDAQHISLHYVPQDRRFPELRAEVGAPSSELRAMIDSARSVCRAEAALTEGKLWWLPVDEELQALAKEALHLGDEDFF